MPTEPTDTPAPTSITDSVLLDLRADLIALTLRVERVLEANGHPVKAPVGTRRERQNLTRTTRKRNI